MRAHGVYVCVRAGGCSVSGPACACTVCVCVDALQRGQVTNMRAQGVCVCVLVHCSVARSHTCVHRVCVRVCWCAAAWVVRSHMRAQGVCIGALQRGQVNHTDGREEWDRDRCGM